MVVCSWSQQHSVRSSIMASVHGFGAACPCQSQCLHQYVTAVCDMQRLLPPSCARLPAVMYWQKHVDLDVRNSVESSMCTFARC